jgi:hypothetical protein
VAFAGSPNQSFAHVGDSLATARSRSATHQSGAPAATRDEDMAAHLSENTAGSIAEPSWAGRAGRIRKLFGPFFEKEALAFVMTSCRSPVEGEDHEMRLLC